MNEDDPERNRLSARIGRMASLGGNLGRAGVEIAAARLLGGAERDARIAAAIKEALGRSKGPLMKVAQILATVPDLLPPEYAAQLASLQSGAPAMGWPFVRRRMRAELGADWERKFASFEHEAFAAASLGQVHRAVAHDGAPLAAKLQYPDMASAVESDLEQLDRLLGLFGRLGTGVDPSEIAEEVGERLREELDYEREAKHMALYRLMHAGDPAISVPEARTDLSSKRLLTMSFLEGRPLTAFEDASQDERNRLAAILFRAWWKPFGQYAVIHGDPHLGNYSFAGAGETQTLNLLDFGCIRVFEPAFVEGVITLREALRRDDKAGIEHAYALWGFPPLKKELRDTLNIWARFLYAPLLEDRVRRVAEVNPAEYGRREFMLMRQGLAQHGPVAIPRAFVFMDRAAVGLGAAFIRLKAELNFSALFDQVIDGFSNAAVTARQREALASVGLQ